MGVGTGAMPLQKKQIGRRRLFYDIFSIKHPEKWEQSRSGLHVVFKTWQDAGEGLPVISDNSNFQELTVGDRLCTSTGLFINAFSTFGG